MSNKKTMFIVLFVLLPVVMMTNQLVKREDCSCPDKVQTLLEVAKEVELVCPIPPTKNPYRWRQCTIGLWGNQTNLPNPSIVSQTWLQTPSIVIIETGHYQALGRIINVKYLKERLTLKDSNFNAASRESMEFVQQLDILADTLYIEGVVVFYGVRNVKVYAREIIASKGSEIAFSTPDWVQGFSNTVGVKNNGDGTDGENGKNGVDGPQVDIYCDVITGEFNVSSKAGNGKKGQNGGDGQKGGDAVNKADKYSNWFWCGAANTLQMYGETESHAWNRAVKTCRGRSRSAERGNNGESGKKGGKAGKPGKGGTAGRVTLHYRKLNGQFKAMVCGGIGAEPANNGKGGNGGEGGQGVPGITCSVDQRGILFFCKKRGRRRAPQGATGQKGASGSTNKTKGRDGMVTEASVRFSQTIDPQSKNGFPEDLLLIIKRQAEDLLLADRNDQKGRDALQFIIKMATGRRDVEYIMKDVQTKLAFLGKDGFDIFGKNSLFTPLVKWETIQSDVNVIKEAAGAYENTFNDIMKQVTSNENIKQIATLMKALASKQVDTQKRSLIADRAIVESQKRMYVKAIIEAERRMNNTLIRIYSSLRKAQHVAQSRLNREQFLAVLQGITGFSSAIFESAVSDKPKGPFAFIDTAVSIAQYDANKPCLSSLGAVIQSAKKWLTFGKYRPLNDSNQLNFDKMDVTSVPDIMKANLEMNKQQLTADLVCLLEEATKPRDVARLKAEMESYFVLGAARIDMIAKVMDLDNDIGTHNFDISLLNQTGKAITKLSESQDASITSRLRQTFVENLLGTYRQLERSFMLKIYELHKALGFRTLWNLDDVMGSFRRIASESALGTGRLNGAVELTKVLLRLSKIIQKAESCFSKLRYSKSVQKWSFNNVNNKQMFEEIKNGSTRFDIGVDQICNTCYNARLIKMYIELYGPETQPDSVWDKVRLRVRHLGRAYFRAGDGHIKQYHQPITNFRDLKFDRFKISNATECRKRKEDPNKSEAHFCVEKEDTRLEPMCSHPLNDHSTGGLMLGKEECTSPSGFYELEIPVNKALSCADTKMRDTNCKDLDLTKFTKMNVWTYFIYWSRRYPKDPNDPVCSVQSDFNSGYRRHRKVTHRCAD